MYFVDEGGSQNFTRDSKTGRHFGELDMGGNIVVQLDVQGSVHHSVNYLEITNKMRPYIRIYYSKIFCCSTRFELHIAHHQELKNSICSLWFYIGLWVPAAAAIAAGSSNDVTNTRCCRYICLRS